jgi:hypothetical protein
MNKLACAAAPNARARADAELYSHAVENRTEFRSATIKSCSELETVDQVIGQAISIGAPIYNAGSPLGCYRIYEGAAYKLLFLLQDRCPEVGALLRGGLARAETSAAVVDKAWTMRRTFDTILGQETAYSPRGGPSP